MNNQREIKIGARGQVVIPVDVRERFGLLPNTAVVFVEQHGQLVLKRASKPRKRDHWAEVRGMLKGKGVDSDADIEEMRGR